MEKCNLNKVSELSSNDGVRSDSFPAGITLVDLGVKAAGGWSAGRTLVENSINGLGDVSFGELAVNGFALPTIDICYDNPVKSGIAESKCIDGREFQVYKDLSLIYTEADEIFDQPELERLKTALALEGNQQVLAVASSTSLVGVIYRCAQVGPLVLEQLLKKGLQEEEILWAWSTVPLPPLADDKGIMAERTKAALKYGSVLSYWVRSEDETIESVLRDIEPYGEVRIHNLRTARTIVKGTLDSGKLQESFRL